jgi:hypothetical protein
VNAHTVRSLTIRHGVAVITCSCREQVVARPATQVVLRFHLHRAYETARRLRPARRPATVSTLRRT